MSLRYEQYNAFKRAKDLLTNILTNNLTWIRANAKQIKRDASLALKHFPPLSEDGVPRFSMDPFSSHLDNDIYQSSPLKDLYIVLPWSDVQEYMEEEWFNKEAIIDIDNKTGYGAQAYLVPLKYLTNKKRKMKNASL